MAKRKHHAIEKVKSAKGSPGRGRLSVGERLVLEMLLAHVVHRLEGKGYDGSVPFSDMLMHGVTMETMASALMLKRGCKSRMFFVDAVSMMGQIARRINSFLLPRIVALRLDLDRQWRSGNGNALDKAEARRIVDEFAYCHDALFVEISFMDVRERANIWPRTPEHPVDRSGRYEVFHPEKGMTAEEATQGSRAAVLRNHRREMRMTGFAKKVSALTACFSRLADEVSHGIASAPTSGHSPDWELLVEVLQTFTTLVYYEFSDMDLYFCGDPRRTNGGADIGMDFANEDTEETCAKGKLGHEIIRYVDAAIALARSAKSDSASGFVLVKSLFEKHDGDFSQAEHSIAVKADLASFIDTLKSSRERLHADVAAAKLGGEAPVRVELTKKSGETIAKAVRPGRGGARRIFGEEVQEKCWHYWEAGRKNPDVARSAESSGRKLRHEDVFKYFRRELAALDPPIDTPEAFESALRARTNRISRKKSH